MSVIKKSNMEFCIADKSDYATVIGPLTNIIFSAKTIRKGIVATAADFPCAQITFRQMESLADWLLDRLRDHKEGR